MRGDTVRISQLLHHWIARANVLQFGICLSLKFCRVYGRMCFFNSVVFSEASNI